MMPRALPRLGRAAAVLALCAALFACATYTPRPLPGKLAWNEQAKLLVDTHQIALPALAGQPIDLAEPLSLSAVAALAVLNAPRLRALRDRSGVAQAQAFAAGLLPDPRLSASRDIPQGDNPGVSSTAYRIGLQFDLGSVITRGAAVDAARAHLKQVDLRILWQEWQTAAAAELDDVTLVGLRQQDSLLRAQVDATSLRLRHDRAAQAAGIATRDAADADRVQLQALRQRLDADARQRASALASLDALLGLRPATPLRLAGLPRFAPAAVQDAARNLPRLARIRPDLLALRAGYASQEQKLREAVLSQFPSVGIGFSRARDTSDVNTLGLGITFSLPLLNGSRGAIAMGKATRRALYDDYELRLGQSRAQAALVLGDIRLLRRQRRSLRSALPALRAAALAADASLRRGDMTLEQAQVRRNAWLDQRLALEVNGERLARQTVALQLLTGSGVFAPALHG